MGSDFPVSGKFPPPISRSRYRRFNTVIVKSSGQEARLPYVEIDSADHLLWLIVTERHHTSEMTGTGSIYLGKGSLSPLWGVTRFIPEDCSMEHDKLYQKTCTEKFY